MVNNMKDEILNFWSDLQARASEFHEVTIPVGALIVFVGLVLRVWRGSQGDTGEILRAIMVAGLLGAVVIPSFPNWVNEAQMMSYAVLKELEIDPSKSYERFALIVVESREGEERDEDFVEQIWSTFSGWGEALMVAIVFVVAKLALAFIWIFYIFQKTVVLFQIALAPVFLAFFMMESTRGIAMRFILVLASVMLWQWGWAIADIMTSALLDQYTYISGAQVLVFILALTSWLLASTIGAPFYVSKLFMQGAGAVSSLLGSYGFAMSQGTSYAIGAATTASFAGSGKGMAAGAGLVGGVGGVLSGAAGSSSILVPTAIGLGMSFGSRAGRKRPDPAEYEELADNFARRASS